MKDQYQVLNKYVLRTPSLPFESIPHKYGLEIFNNQLLESIFIASPDLYEECKRWIKAVIDKDDTYEYNKVINSVHKYIIRMSSRCTPFGLFAGCSVGTFSDESKVLKKTETKQLTRLDMNYICDLGDQIGKVDEVRKQLKFFPNNSMYIVGDKMRLVTYSFVKGKRIYSIVSIDINDYILKVINRAMEGALLSDLINNIIDEEISSDEAIDYINDLIDNQILISELYPNVTGLDYFSNIIKVLTKINDDSNDSLSHILHKISKLNEIILDIDNNFESDPNKYNDVVAQVSNLGIDYDKKYLLQVDLIHKFQENNLGKKVQESIYDAIYILNMITRNSRNEELNNFKENLINRYEGKRISLLEALDNEFGIGYGGQGGDISPILNNIYFNSLQSDEKMTFTLIDKFLLSKVIEATKNSDIIINIQDTDLNNISKTESNNLLPDSLSIMLSVLDYNGSIHVKSCGGLTAGRLLARFTHASKEIDSIVEEITLKEKELESDKVLAEIVHLPESRMGNILTRKAYRDYEIPYLASSSMEKEGQIMCQDLEVSVENNQIKLFSRRLSKEVLPRLSSAHNFSHNSLPIYRFLCDLQGYNQQTYFGFEWNIIFNSFDFLPRLVYKNVVIKPARWRFEMKSLTDLIDTLKKGDEKTISEFMCKRNLPKFVVYAIGDNELVIDLSNKLSRMTLVQYIEKTQVLHLYEFLFDHTDFVVKNEQLQGFTNEVIATLIKKQKVQDLQSKMVRNDNEYIPKRIFIVKSEWLYYKFYIGFKNSDLLLCNYIEPLLLKLYENGLISSWFFVRYSDPDHHIRVRFHLNKHNYDLNQVIDYVNKSIEPLVDNGIIWKVQLDTYQREIERYGAEAIELVENIFEIDSDFVVKLLNLLDEEFGKNLRWLAGIKMVNDFLQLAYSNLNETEKLVDYMRTSFANEFNHNSNTKIQLDTQFRKYRNDINNIINNLPLYEMDLTDFYKIFEERKEKLNPLITKLINIHLEFSTTEFISSRICSIIHMSLNKLFRTKQRTNEYIIYEYLHRKYKSDLGRTKKEKKSI